MSEDGSLHGEHVDVVSVAHFSFSQFLWYSLDAAGFYTTDCVKLVCETLERIDRLANAEFGLDSAGGGRGILFL